LRAVTEKKSQLDVSKKADKEAQSQDQNYEDE
jgi:hypothetical protein